MKLSFVWQGVTDRFNHWQDGLKMAMLRLEEIYEIEYIEPWTEPSGDVILYWEAPCTINGANKEYYEKVRHNTKTKILLFAGGPLKKEWVEGFDILCVESEINEKECNDLGINYERAFGINEYIFKPEKLEKKWDAIHHGTCASWKRQWLMGQTVGKKGLLVGRYQESDPRPFDESKKFGTTILPEQSYEEVAKLINQSETLLQTADFWGGGQRATLEAMACGVPVVCMTDSPKNIEFVEGSKFGEIVEPEPGPIKDAIQRVKKLDPKLGIDYVNNNWTSKDYAKALNKAIKSL